MQRRIIFEAGEAAVAPSGGQGLPGDDFMASNAPSMVACIVQTDQAILRSKLFPLHLGEGDVVDWQYAEFRVHHLLVQITVALIELLELGVGTHQRVDFLLRLFFEHGASFNGCLLRWLSVANAGLMARRRGSRRKNAPAVRPRR
jgi:hypothetical protein